MRPRWTAPDQLLAGNTIDADLRRAIIDYLDTVAGAGGDIADGPPSSSERKEFRIDVVPLEILTCRDAGAPGAAIDRIARVRGLLGVADTPPQATARR